jgi:hypothetical protein
VGDGEEKSLLNIEESRRVLLLENFTIIVVVNGIWEAEAPHCIARWRLHESPMTASTMN